MISFCCCCVCFVQSIPMHRNADGYGKSHHIKSSNIPFSLGGSFIFQTFCKCKSPFHVRGSLIASNSRYNHEPLKNTITFDKQRPWRIDKKKPIFRHFQRGCVLRKSNWCLQNTASFSQVCLQFLQSIASVS